MKYDFRNPVAAGVCKSVEDYPYSTLQTMLGKAPSTFPLYFPFGVPGFIQIPSNERDLLAWLNRPTPKEQLKLIQKGLKKTTFSFSPKSLKKALVLEGDDALPGALFDAPPVQK
jgi:hypothetical protein